MNEKDIFQKNSVILSLALLCTLLWGSAYPSIKIGYSLFSIGENDIFGKLLFAGNRFALAGILVILLTWIIQKKFPLPKRQALGPIALLGFIQTTLEYLFFYIGLSHTTGVKGSILNATATFIAVILAHFVYSDDKLNTQKVLGCIIGFMGIVIINLGGEFGSGFSFTGEGFIILAAASFAIGSLISKEAAKREDSMIVTGWQLLFGGILLVIIGVLGGAKFSIPSTEAMLLLFYLAILSSVAFTLWTMLLKHNNVGKVSIYNFLTPIFGVFLSAIFLKESIWHWKNLLALVLVCIGIYIVNRPTAENN
ncbi:DMT family transporter [Clostridium sp. UBA1056]|uniref:DMT family transporter n=1 Tax=unclassified Clostridium TaxID=2614128 RepID=UPI0032165845